MMTTTMQALPITPTFTKEQQDAAARRNARNLKKALAFLRKRNWNL